jgi:hypothetical protein
MRFAWVNLGLGVAWPKTLARSGHPSVIGATRVQSGSESVDAEADKTEQRPQSILLRWWRRPSYRFCFVLTQPILSCWAMAASPPCLCALQNLHVARRAREFPPSARRASAGWVPLVRSPQKILTQLIAVIHPRRTSNPIHGCCANHDHIVPI